MRPARRAKGKRKESGKPSSSPASKKRRKSSKKKITIEESSSSPSESESSDDEVEEVEEAEEQEQSGDNAASASVAVAANNSQQGRQQNNDSLRQASADTPMQSSSEFVSNVAPPAPSVSSALLASSAVPAVAASPAVPVGATPSSEEEPRAYSMFDTHLLNDHKSLIYKDPLAEEDYNALSAWLMQTVLNCVKACHIYDARAVEQIAKHTLSTHIWQINTAREEDPGTFRLLNRQRSDNMLRVVTENVVGLAIENAECSTFRSISNNVRVNGKAHLMVESSFEPDSNGVYDLRRITNHIVSVLKTEEFVNHLCLVAFQDQQRFPVCEQLTRRMFEDWRRTNKAPGPLKEMTNNIVQTATSRYIYSMVDKIMS